MASFKLPSEESVISLFSMLFGKDVESKECDSLDTKKTTATGVYTDNDGKVQAICVFDLELSAFSSAALSMINADVAQDVIKDNELSESFQENLYEVFNVSVGLFNNTGSSEGIRLHEMHISPPELPKPVELFIEKGTKKIGYEIDIPVYGSGKMLTYML